MPIWLRKFTYQQIVEAKQQEADSYKKTSTKSNKPGRTSIDLANPNLDDLPDYAKSSTSSTFNTRASKK